MDRSDPERVQPIRELDRPKYYIGAALFVMLLGVLPAIALNWYAIEIDSGMHQRISMAMIQIAGFVGGVVTVPLAHEAAKRAVVGAGQRPSLLSQLRLVPWSRIAAVYFLATAAAAPVVVADAYGHATAFPALVCVLLALHAASLIPALRRPLSRLPALVLGVALGIPLGLIAGGMQERGYLIEEPWFWISLLLIGLAFLRMFREEAAAKVRKWRQGRAAHFK